MIVSLNKDIKIASVAFRKLNGKKNRGSTAFKDMASAISLQCSTNCAMKTHTHCERVNGPFPSCPPASVSKRG